MALLRTEKQVFIARLQDNGMLSPRGGNIEERAAAAAAIFDQRPAVETPESLLHLLGEFDELRRYFPARRPRKLPSNFKDYLQEILALADIAHDRHLTPAENDVVGELRRTLRELKWKYAMDIPHARVIRRNSL